MLAANATTKGELEDVTGCTTGRQTTGINGVRLMSPWHHHKLEQKYEKWE
jgi:hypothetical protein